MSIVHDARQRVITGTIGQPDEDPQVKAPFENIKPTTEGALNTGRPLPDSAPGRIRTCDQWIRSPLLYPLSYGRLRGQ